MDLAGIPFAGSPDELNNGPSQNYKDGVHGRSRLELDRGGLERRLELERPGEIPASPLSAGRRVGAEHLQDQAVGPNSLERPGDLRI